MWEFTIKNGHGFRSKTEDNSVMGQDPKGRSNPLVIPILNNHTGLSEDGTAKLQRSIVSLDI